MHVQCTVYVFKRKKGEMKRRKGKEKKKRERERVRDYKKIRARKKDSKRGKKDF